MIDSAAFECPIPISEYPRVTLAHGGGGRLMNDLIDRMMFAAFGNPLLEKRHDGAVFDVPEGRMAFSTDSHVITPLFYPGGDIGSLAVYGTMNDLAMCGACSGLLTAGFIIEEGFPMESLWKIVRSMSEAADRSGAMIVSGDTKVVERGKGDGLYINTSGTGMVPEGVDVSPARISSGDRVILSGDIGRHGMAIMTIREGIGLESEILSDLAPLGGIVRDLIEEGIDIHCMRDLTRGGLASGLVELSTASGHGIAIEEQSIPVSEPVMAACEILGFDPLYVANEGRFVLIVPDDDAERVLQVLRTHESGTSASIIGEIGAADGTGVVMTSSIGAQRIVDMMSGEQLPRIC